MKRIVLALLALSETSVPSLAQQDYGHWRMHEWMGWGWGGMWLGPLFMIVSLALLVAAIVALVRWMGGDRGGPTVTLRSAREILDERYARGEIDREEYVKRRADMASQ